MQSTYRVVAAPHTASSKVRRIKATGLLHDLARQFVHDHGQVLKELQAAHPENRERILRASPGMARKLELFERVQALLGGKP